MDGMDFFLNKERALMVVHKYLGKNISLGLESILEVIISSQ